MSDAPAGAGLVIKGLSVLVSGGASGIGLATAAAFCRQGARVSVLDKEIAAVEPPISAHQADVRSADDVSRAVEAVLNAEGGIDVVVNCAGVPSRGGLESLSDDEWLRIFDVNVVGMARVVRAALPHLRRSSHASVVNVSSVSANVGLTGLSAYSASKGAIQALTRALAAELITDRIRVNSVSPGTVDTPWIRQYFASLPDPVAAEESAHRRQPTGRMVTAEEVADAICFLVGAGSVTGIDVPIDGGMSKIRVE